MKDGKEMDLLMPGKKMELLLCIKKPLLVALDSF